MALAYDKYAKAGAFHWKNLDTDSLYRLRVETVLRHVKPKHVCLDLGCGDGAYMGLVAKRCGRVIGIDIEKLAVKLANQQFEKRRILNAKAIWSDFKDALPRLGRKRFDVVYAMDVVEHLEVPTQLFDLAHGAVRENGVFLVGTPLFAGDRNVSPYHVHEFTMRELMQLATGKFRVSRVHDLPDKLRDGSVSPNRFAVLALRAKRL